MDFTPAYFSFNTEGGRCEACKGEGVITVEMQFLADVTIADQLKVAVERSVRAGSISLVFDVASDSFLGQSLAA